MSVRIEVRAPAEQTEGTRSQILRWLKQVGDAVAESEPLIEIETDKVTVEVAAPAAGVLREILRHEQEEIVPGELLGWLEPEGKPVASPIPVGAGGGAGALAERRNPSGTPPAAGRSSAASAPLSPAVRRLLAERGLEAADVPGTGPGGRVTVEDVLRAAGAAAPLPPPSAAAQEPDAAPEGVRRVPHSAVRRRIAQHMVQSLLHTAPHVTTVFEADLTAVLEDRAQRREEFARQGVPLTLTAYFVEAAVAAIRVVPEANSRWTEEALEVFNAVHVGIGTAVEGSGLVVPVLRDAHTRDLLDIARGLDDLVTRARAGRLAPADVRGGTFTLSNHGVSGSLLAAPIIINQPQSAILGIGKLERRAVVLGEGAAETIGVRPRCYVTLTLDHRVMDGHQANRFMQTLVDSLGRRRS
jgi:2-oxoglutarate dehydrogenase E2 component (dihydrolipoamide succinyltransferase)